MLSIYVKGISDLRIYVTVTSPYPWDWGVTVQGSQYYRYN